LAGILVTATVSSGQQIRLLPTDTLAEVSGGVITARDLQERLELMPWPGKEHSDQNDSVKIRALQSIVAEQLLATEAEARGIGNDSASVRRLRSLERLLVKDELYRREILPKTAPTRTEIEEGLKRAPWSIQVNALISATQEDAARVFRAFRGGNPDSVAGTLPATLVAAQHSLTISYGAAQRAFENVAYTLSPSKPAASPLFVKSLGWVVLVYHAKIRNEDFLKLSLPERVRSIENTARRLKEVEVAGKYYAAQLSPKKAEADTGLFDRLARASRQIMQTDTLRFRKQGLYNMTFILDTLEQILEPVLDSGFVRMDGGPMTVRELLEGYRYLRLGLPSLEDGDFRTRLNGSIRDIVAAEYLAREGFRQNLQYTEAVRHDMAIWTGYWKSLALVRSLQESVQVTPEDVMRYLTEKGEALGSSSEVNIREVLTDSLSTSARLLELALNGDDLAQLARQFSKRRGWAERGGESGWFRVSAYPELGFRALEADSGALIGPLKVRNGYSFFKVLGKHPGTGDSLVSVDSLKTVAGQIVRAEKVQQLLNRRIAELARSQGVKMHYRRLREVDVTRQNMVTRRLIGFGGSMIAVPTLVPQYLWINEAHDLKDILP
jgi:parvulin-like peptidyl-prolyl isomerase